MANRIFIDCGFHHGEGLKHFIKLLGINNDWKIVVFEPNPYCYVKERLAEMFPVGDVPTYNQAAVWTHNLGVSFVTENHFRTQSGSPTDGRSMLDGWSSRIDRIAPIPENMQGEETLWVSTIDFSEYIRYIPFVDNDNNKTEIYCKIDIEGAEFAVLRKMLQDDTVKYIKHLWVEFHENLVPGESLRSKRELIKQLSQHTTVTEWH